VDGAKPLQNGATEIDPITLEVIRHGVIAICNQIDANITRTAFSPYIYEYKDFAVGLLGPDGELIAQNTDGMPPFVADSVGMAVRDGLKVYGKDRLHHGDVVVCNHAAVQGQHLNNTVMYTPIRVGARHERLIGFFAINMHWIDIGGSVPRSRDIFEEGLQLRSIKIWSKGEPIEEVYRIIENNTRFPEELTGDIAAQLSGCLLGRDSVAALADKYGPDLFRGAIDLILDQSEAAARAFIRSIPDGTYEAETFLDGDGENDTPLPIRVKVVVAGDELTIDYSGLAGQVAGCINAGYSGGGRTTARVAFKYLLGADEPANEGTFRPLKLVLPQGKILSADPSAPMGNYSRSFPTVIDAVIKAFEHALPDRVVGGHFGNFAVVRFIGKRRDGSGFDCIDAGHGGWGAGAQQDGDGPFRTMAHGNTQTIPVELLESLYPFRVEEFALRADSGGAGTFRGGLGYSKTYRMTGGCTLRIDFDRVKYPPWGVRGGRDGKPGRVLIRKAESQDAELVYKTKGYALKEGDVIDVEIAGGGGYGPPSGRSRALIERDLMRGYVSAKAAAEDYGVSFDAGGSTGLKPQERGRGRKE
jgi:N-methylhydantoinase B